MKNHYAESGGGTGKSTQGLFKGVITLIVLCAVAAAGQEAGSVAIFDEALYVDPSGSDSNPGTEDQPLETIQKAMDQATENKNNGLSTKVNIGEGEYREAVEFAFSNYNGSGTNSAVVVEGAGPDKTVIKGSEEYDNWTDEGGGVYSHSWPNNWGVSSDPTGGYITDCNAHPNFCADEPDLVLRREMVFVDGERMEQVLTSGDMEAGAFRVDESESKIFLQPPSGVTLSNARVEVAEREIGWNTQHENNFTLRGLRVEHHATTWQQGKAAVTVKNGSDCTVENVAIVQNNWDGLRPRGENFTLRNFVLNDNGHSGLQPFRVKAFLMEDGEVNRNNWRGALGGYAGWTPGNKFFKSRDVTIRNVDFANNESIGLWFDNDHKNVLIENVRFEGNLRDGLWLEQMQGPTTLNRVAIVDNGGFGVLISDAEDTTIENSTIEDNTQGGLNITGEPGGGGRTFTNFTNGNSQTVQMRGLTLNDNIIQGVEKPQTGTPGRHLIGGTFFNTWSDFIATYEADGNTWYDPEDSEVFEWRNPNEMIDLAEWQSRTGEDQNSVFQEP